MKIEITTSIQAFMMEMIGFLTHGVVSPCLIFWASSEARYPARLLFSKYGVFFATGWIKLKEKLSKKPSPGMELNAVVGSGPKSE